MRRRDLLAALPALAATALPAFAQASPRPFRLGTTRWPPDLTMEAVAMVDRFLATECDMSAPMVLGGVPWVDAAGDRPFSLALMNELGWTAPRGHKVLLSLGALDFGRQGLAPLYAEADNQPLPPDWADRGFDDPEVIGTYTAFCLRAVEIMRPDWLCIGVEVNLLLHNRPDLWPAYKRLHRDTYRAVKARYPDLPVLFSAEVTHLWGLDGADAEIQRREVAALAEDTDMIGFSLYTHMNAEAPDPLPPGYYDALTRFGDDIGKPVCITESGMSSEPAWIGWSRLRGSPEMQVSHLTELLATAERGRYPFVVNFTSHDYDTMLPKLPRSVRTVAKIWAWTGIVDSQGADKAVTGLWRQAMARPLG